MHRRRRRVHSGGKGTNCSRDADQQLGGGMKILVSFPHALGSPGIGWTAWNQVNELVRRGHEVTVVAASVANPVAGATLVQSLSVAGRRIPHRAVGRDRAFAWHDRVAQRTYEKVRPEVVHLWPLAPGLTAAAACSAAQRWSERHRTPTPSTRGASSRRRCARSDWTAPSRRRTRPMRPPAMEQAEWDAATGVLAPSTVVAESFVAEGFPPSGSSATSTASPPARAASRPGRGRPAPARDLRRPRRTEQGTALCAAGLARFRREPRRHVHDRRPHAPRLPRSAGRRASHPSVRVVGFSSSVGAALAASDVLLLPTIEEGSALVTYEAQGAGCVPLVSSAAGAMLDDGVQGLIHEPRDVAALTGISICCPRIVRAWLRSRVPRSRTRRS